MPVELTPADGYLRVTMHGVVTAQEFADYAQKSESMELQQPESLHRITDLTGVTHFELHYEDVFELANRRRRQQLTRPVKSAIIVREPVQIGMARMFQTMAASDFMQIQVVKSLAEALDWIGALPSCPSENERAVPSRESLLRGL